MSRIDWNHDGKIDFKDTQMDYFVYQQVSKEQGWSEDDNQNSIRRSTGSSAGGNIDFSTGDSIFCVLSGLILQAVLYTAMGIDASDIPGIVLLLMWIVLSFVTAFFVLLIKSK